MSSTWTGPAVVPVVPAFVQVDGRTLEIRPYCRCERDALFWLDGITPWCGYFGCDEAGFFDAR